MHGSILSNIWKIKLENAITWYKNISKIQQEFAFLVCAAPHTLKMRFFHNFRVYTK